MAEGGYDPTTENENPAVDIALDNDDDDDTTPPPGTTGTTSTPYQPGAAYHPGEEHEMTNFQKKQSGVVHGPGNPAWKALTHIFHDASATELDAYIVPTTQRLVVKMAGAGKPSFYLFTTERGTGVERLNPKLTNEIRRALGESTLDKSTALQQERDRNTNNASKETNKTTTGGGGSELARGSTNHGRHS